MSLSELQQLQTVLSKTIASFEDRRKAEVLAKLTEIAGEMGYALADIVPSEAKIIRPPVAWKYRHPKDATVTWSGRGRMPRWFAEALAAGVTPDDLSIA